MFVASEILPDDDMLSFVLTVPLLVRVLWARTGFRRGDIEDGLLSGLIMEECRLMCPFWF